MSDVLPVDRWLRPERLLAAGALVVLVLACVTAAAGWRLDPSAPLVEGGDVRHYADVGSRALAGELPYRDFELEYPPGALPAFVLPALGGGGPEAFAGRFGLLIAVLLVCIAGFGYLIARTLELPRWRQLAVPLLVAATPVLLGPVATKRFDLWPAAAVAAAVALALGGRSAVSGIALAIGISAKLYPIVLLPIVLAHVHARGGRAGLARFGLGGGATLALGWIPFLVLAPHGVWASVSSQVGRALQVESSGAVAVTLLGRIPALAPGVGQRDELNSVAVTGTAASAAGWLATIAFVLVVACSWYAAWRGRERARVIVASCAAVLVATVAFGHVLSPQFLLWLVPLVFVLAGDVGVAAALGWVVLAVLTNVWYPRGYASLAFDSHSNWVALVAVRDAGLVALALTLVVAVVRLVARQE